MTAYSFIFFEVEYKGSSIFIISIRKQNVKKWSQFSLTLYWSGVNKSLNNLPHIL